MGAVYEAFDNRLQTKVAIKEALVSDAALKRAFSKEALRLARLHHAALPNVSDHFTEHQRQYLVMRFIEGQDLGEMLIQHGQAFGAPTATESTPEIPSASAIATPAFPLLAGTPLPQSLTVISNENASELREIGRWGKGRVEEVAYSPDGKLLAVGASIGIYLYDAETLQELRFLNSQEWNRTIAFSPDGALLAANGPENSIQLWQVSDGQLLTILQGHTFYVPDRGITGRLQEGSGKEAVTGYR